MIRRIAVFELLLTTLLIAAVVGDGLSDQWGWPVAILCGFPFLVWTYFTWRRMVAENEQEYTLPFVLRIFVICLIASFLLIESIRDIQSPHDRDCGPIIGLLWMAAPFVLFARKALAVRRDLYQK
jgi:hypothetical protein